MGINDDIDDAETYEEWSIIRVVRDAKTHRVLLEECYHEPEPREGLKLHDGFKPARRFYDRDTGEVTRLEHFHLGDAKLIWSSDKVVSDPEP